LTEMGTQLPDFDRETYVREVASLTAKANNAAAGELDTGRLLYELINASFKSGLRLPAELTLLAKTLFNLDSVTRSLDSSYTPIPTIRDYTTQIIADRARRELNPRHLYQLFVEGSNLVTKLPHR